MPLTDEIALITDIITFNFTAIDPLFIVVFSLMGIWPLVHTSLLLTDGRNKRIPSWPFLLTAFLAGAYVLTLYLIIRSYQKPTIQSNRLDRLIGSTPWLTLLSLFTLGLVLFGLLSGNPVNYVNAITKYFFIRVMTLDFILFTAITPIAIYIHSINNSIEVPRKLPLIGLIPILGALFYLLKYKDTAKEK
jgi:hypothetical protein